MDRHPLSPGGNTLVILDTCVLVPSRLSDVLFDLMLEGLHFAYWTGDVEASSCATGRWCIPTHRSQVPNGSRHFNGPPTMGI